MRLPRIPFILLLTTRMNEDPSESSNLRLMEFFSGIGGMRLAVEQALQEIDDEEGGHGGMVDPAVPFRTSCQAYDISLHANRCYQHNFIRKDGSTRSQVDDKVSTKLVEQLKAVDLDGKADLWTMSPPCQPFTSTRGSKGLDMDDKRCHGLLGLMKLLTSLQHKPRWIFLENVKGFATSRMCQAWKECLEQNGYAWKEYLLSPVQLGIPNHRLRYYILCELDSTRWSNQLPDNSASAGDDIHQEPSHGKVRPQRVVQDYVDHYLTTLKDLEPYIVPDSVLEKDWAQDLGIVAGADTATRCFTAGYGRILSKATGSVLLFRHLSDNTPTTDLPLENPAQQRAIAHDPIDRSDMTKYSGQLRRFSPVELLALFGFPSWFTFPSDIPLEHHYKLIGNSINVSVVADLLRELLWPWKNDGIQPPTLPAEANDDRKDNNYEPRDHHPTEQLETPSSSLPTTIETNKATTWTLPIGGIKGHVPETIRGNLLRLYQAFQWKPLPNCTGRYTCREHKIASPLPPLELLSRIGIATLGDDYFAAEKESSSSSSTHLPLQQYSFDLPGRSDRILVIPLDSRNHTGVITYEKSDGSGRTSYVHTLNSPSGFRRKLQAIGIDHITDDEIIAIEAPN